MRVEPAAASRPLRRETLDADLVVVGGGLAGTCCALAAARAGIRVTLVQDRPVLGGNASSEVRLWVLGATAHMTNNNRWAREGGIVDELLVENLWRNPEGNPLIFDTVLLEKVTAEPGVRLLLNTAVHAVEKSAPDRVGAALAFCSQNSTAYELRAPLFCDASGDGIVGYLSGAAFRMGAEQSSEFGEGFAPSEAYGELLGHSIYFYSKDAGRPVTFVPPAYALSDVPGAIPRFRSFTTRDHGCRLWWIELGGRKDTVHDTEAIKWDLWKVVWGVWNYIKNSGQFPDAANLTLEWVGHIPGKRESRRFEGDHMLSQREVVEQVAHDDDVSYGGWSIDLHPADGVFSEKPGCNQWHSRGVYPIPYRCLYSRDVRNLFLAGRDISASHVAFGSTRVMATCAHAAQAAGVAAAICARRRLLPRDLREGVSLRELRRDLIRTGQYVPDARLEDPDDLAQQATITASSVFALWRLPDDGPALKLDAAWAQMLPLPAGKVPAITFGLHAPIATMARFELRTSERVGGFTPDRLLDAQTVEVPAGTNVPVRVAFAAALERPAYVFVCLPVESGLGAHLSNLRVTGLLSVRKRYTQKPPAGIGVETFDVWCPERRPGGHNVAFALDTPVSAYAPANVANGIARPTVGANAWVADPADPRPTLNLRWSRPRSVARVVLGFDTDLDHPMESVLMGHPERAMPFCVRDVEVTEGKGRSVAIRDNHETRRQLRFNPPVVTDRLDIRLGKTWGGAPPALFEVRCYGR